MSVRNVKILAFAVLVLIIFWALAFFYVYAGAPVTWLSVVTCEYSSTIISWFIILILLVLASFATIKKPVMLIPLYILAFLFIHFPSSQDWQRFLDPLRCHATSSWIVQIFLVNIPLVVVLQTYKKLKESS